MKPSVRKLTAAVCVLFWAAAPSAVSTANMDDTAGPVDIRADQQEFGDEKVTARGNVCVNYRDSVITGPMATLFRDPDGNPQRAIFTGNPRLVQGGSTINAATITFDIKNQRVIAEGRAHSEVPAANTDATRSGDVKTAGNDRIITDSDRQEYDRAGGKFEAIGNVRVRHGDITVRSDKLNLVYGTDNKPETAVFTGRVVAIQGKNSTEADNMTYSLTTRRLQATGSVKSKVIQEKKPEEAKKNPLSFMQTSGIQAAHAEGPASGAVEEEEPIIITSSAQEYSRDSGRLSATGNVKVQYGTTTGIGPKAVLTRDADGKADFVVFIGRSQIMQPGRRWIADSITFSVADKKVHAQGNTKAYILQSPGKDGAPAVAGSRLAGRAGGPN